MALAQGRKELEKILTALLVTRPESTRGGVPISLLEKDYKEQVGKGIPFRDYGYSCLLDFLYGMPDALTIRYRNGAYNLFPVVTEATMHVSSLVAGQRSKRPHRGGRKYYRPSSYYPRVQQPPVRLDSSVLSDIVRLAKKTPEGVPMSQVLELARRKLNYDIDLNDLNSQLRDISHEVIVELGVLYSVSSYHRWEQEKKRRDRDKWGDKESRKVPDSTRDTGVDTKPAGMSDEETEDAYQENSVAFSNYNNPRRKSERSNDEKESPGGFADRKDQEAKTTRSDGDNSDDGENILINKRTKIRLEKLIEKHPEGIWCAELPALYQKEYTIPLSYEEYGFASVIDYAAHLPKIFHYVRPQAQGDYKLFSAKAKIPDIKESKRPKVLSLAALYDIEQQYGLPEEPIPSVLSKSTIEKLVPEGVMTVGETVGQICVTELFRGVHDYIEVVVADVYTPSYFWIQLIKRLPKFNAFMAQLHEFYEINAEKYSMPVAVMEKGMNCACLYADRWHRGIIKSKGIYNDVTVLFYDYGTIKSYSTDSIYFLHRSFSNLLAQAIPCGLYNVKPVDGTRWSRVISLEFVAQVSNVPLIATVASIDTDNNSMLVGLTNTQGDEDFHINDWMIESGFAVFGKMVRIRPPNYPYRRFLECQLPNSSEGGIGFPSSDSKELNLERNNVVVDSGTNKHRDSTGFYDILLKLHRDSRAGKSTSIETAENMDISSDEKSSTDEQTKPKDVRNDFMTYANRKLPIEDSAVAGSEKIQRARLLREMCERNSRRKEPSGDSNGIGKLETGRDETHSVDGGSTSSSSIEQRQYIHNKNHYKTKLTEDEEISNKSVSDGDVICGTKRIFIRDGKSGKAFEPHVQTVPLHLRDFPEPTDGLPEFGTIRSRLGGQGRMEPIDWSVVRREDVVEKTRKISTSSSRSTNYLDKHPPEQQRIKQNRDNAAGTRFVSFDPSADELYDNSNRNRSAQVFTQGACSKSSIDKSVKKHTKELQHGSDLNENVKQITGESWRRSNFVEMTANIADESLEKSEADEHVKSISEGKESFDRTDDVDKERATSGRKLPKAKRLLWDIVKSNSEVKKKEIGGEATASTEIVQKVENETMSKVEKIVEKEIGLNRRQIPEFGKFHSMQGGNGRLEPVTWSEIRAKINSPDKVIEAPTQSEKPLGVKTPDNLPKANKTFMKIMNQVLSRFTNPDLMFVPEGNIKMGSDVISPWIRIFDKKLKKRHNERLKLFIPDNLLELMKNSENDSTNSQENMFNDSTTSSESPRAISREILNRRKLRDFVKARLSESAKNRVTDTSTESEMNDSYKGPEKSLKVNAAVDDSRTTRVGNEDIRRAGEPVDETTGKRSLSLEEKLTNDKVSGFNEKKTSPSSIDRHRSDENLRTNNKKTSSPENINAWLQKVCLRPNSQELSKVIDFRGGSKNESGLDSDDLSVTDEIEDDQNETLISDDFPKCSIDNLKSEISRKNNERVEEAIETTENSSGIQEFMDEDSKADFSTARPDSTLESVEESTVDAENKEILDSSSSEESSRCSKFGNIEIPKNQDPISGKANIDEVSLAILKSYAKCLPVFNDVDMKSNADDDEWDYSPGWFGEVPENDDDGVTIEEILANNDTEAPALERILSGDESSLEISENLEVDTSPNGTSRKESDTDTESSEKTTRTPMLNRVHTKQDSPFEKLESSSFPGSSSTKEPFISDIVPADDISDRSDENVTKSAAPKKRYQILNEIMKSKILGTHSTSEVLDGNCSSGERSNRSYSNFIIDVAKRYR